MIKKILDNITSPEKGEVSHKAISFNLIACMIGVMLCIVSLTAATWAWFGNSISSPVNSVQTGVYTIDVTVVTTDGGDDAVLLPNDDGSYSFDALTEYTVTLKAEGNVSTGYCAIVFASHPDMKLHTSQIFTDESDSDPKSITFSLTVSSDESVRFESWWGTFASPERDVVAGGDYFYDSSVGAVS